MKVGDLVKFSKQHSSRPGYEYCARWIGLVYARTGLDSRAKIYWVTGESAGLTGEIPTDLQTYEIINEGR